MKCLRWLIQLNFDIGFSSYSRVRRTLVKQFEFYVFDLAVKTYCNSTDNSKIESLLKNLIKSISDDSDVGKFSDVLNQPSNYDNLTQIFGEMFKIAYSVKLREWIC